MNCLKEERIIDLAEGQQAAQNEQAHLESCGACRQALQRVEEDRDLLQQFSVSCPIPNTDEGLAFGAYSGCREIASGAMSRVYQAHTVDGDEVAVKVCRDQSLLDSFCNEVKMLDRCAKANVPGIIPLLDAQLEHLPAFIVTPYFSRGTLSGQLQKGRHSEQFILAVASGLARSLAALAQLGIVHGDLKSSNILLDENDQAWLADLGGARRVNTPNQSSTLSFQGHSHMSLISMSPEQARGEELSPASDIFSFGVILYQLACSSHPFSGGTSWEMASRILTEEAPDPRSKLPAALQESFAEILLACLNKDPQFRPSAASLLEKLEQISLKTVTENPILPSVSKPRALIKHKSRKILMSTLIALPIAALLLNFSQPSSAEKPQVDKKHVESTSSSSASSISISSKTSAGQTIILANGKEVWKGTSAGEVQCHSHSSNGKSYAAAFDGDKLIWENIKGAAAKITAAKKAALSAQQARKNKLKKQKAELEKQKAKLEKLSR